MTPIPENSLSSAVIGAAIQVHRVLGPGLLESVYEAALALELTRRGCSVSRKGPIRALYDGMDLGPAFRADLVVDDLVLLELKSVERVTDVHRKQLNTYVRLSGLRLGLLINFGSARLADGVQRVVNGLPDA